MKILVVGGGGYIGNVLCRDLLRRGYYVRCVDNFHKGHCDPIIGLISRPGFEFQYGDVTNVEHVKRMWDGCDACIHLAAIVGFPQCDAQPSLARATNVDGVMHMLDHRNGRPFMFASTGSVYGKVEGLCTEHSSLNTTTLYGQTKKVGEQMVTDAGKHTVSFRFATGFGASPNMRVNLLVNDLVHQAVTNRCLNIFQPDFRRTFIHVNDISRAFIFGLEHIDTLKHKVYNCGDNNLNWTKRDLAEYIKKETGAFVSYNESGTDLDQRDYEVDYSRLNDESFQCVKSMEEGINELIQVSPLLRIRHQYE